MSDDKTLLPILLDINKNVGELHGKVDAVADTQKGMGEEIGKLKTQVYAKEPHTCTRDKDISDLQDDVKSLSKTIWKWGGAIGSIITIAGIIAAFT